MKKRITTQVLYFSYPIFLIYSVIYILFLSSFWSTYSIYWTSYRAPLWLSDFLNCFITARWSNQSISHGRMFNERFWRAHAKLCNCIFPSQVILPAQHFVDNMTSQYDIPSITTNSVKYLEYLYLFDHSRPLTVTVFTAISYIYAFPTNLPQKYLSMSRTIDFNNPLYR